MRRLFGLIGPYGVAAGRVAARDGAAGLMGWLEEASGIVEVERLLHAHLVRRTAALKASHALEQLEHEAAGAARRDDWLELVEEARLDGVMHPLREIRALQALLREHRDGALRDRLQALTTGGDDRARVGLAPGVPAAELAQHARQAAADAQSMVTTALSPFDADAARVVARSYRLIAERAEAAGS
jgi:hypothetical protein